MTVVHCTDDAFGLGVARQIEMVMDGGDNQIEVFQADRDVRSTGYRPRCP